MIPSSGQKTLSRFESLTRALGRRSTGSSRCTSLRRLVLAQALERRRAQVPVVRPLGERDLADELAARTHTTSPFRTFGIFGTVANGDVVACERLELRQQLVDRRAR